MYQLFAEELQLAHVIVAAYQLVGSLSTYVLNIS